MASERVDLTEHRDFRTGPMSLFEDLLIATYMGERMSCEEYDAIKKWENIFGRRRHFTQKNSIFRDKKEEAYLNDMRTHCHRCGKELRVPWKTVQGLCQECDKQMDFYDVNEKVPWKKKEQVRDDREILSLR